MIAGDAIARLCNGAAPKSFKQSLIAIAFAGMSLEALLSLVGNAHLGKVLYNKIDRYTYEEKLRLLGVFDPAVLSSCKRFRKARNDLMHEKPVNLEALETAAIRMAQEEAVFGVEFVKSIREHLKLPNVAYSRRHGADRTRLG